MSVWLCEWQKVTVNVVNLAVNLQCSLLCNTCILDAPPFCGAPTATEPYEIAHCIYYFQLNHLIFIVYLFFNTVTTQGLCQVKWCKRLIFLDG